MTSNTNNYDSTTKQDPATNKFSQIIEAITGGNPKRYLYQKEDGGNYWIERFDPKNSKKFFKPDEIGYKGKTLPWGVKHFTQSTLYIVEGEKTCLAMLRHNYPCITWRCGQGNWQETTSWNDIKRFEEVRLIPDNGAQEDMFALGQFLKNKFPKSNIIYEHYASEDYPDKWDVADLKGRDEWDEFFERLEENHIEVSSGVKLANPIECNPQYEYRFETAQERDERRYNALIQLHPQKQEKHNSYKVSSPLRKDKNPSLQVTLSNGKLLLKDWGEPNATMQDILTAAGLWDEDIKVPNEYYKEPQKNDKPNSKKKDTPQYTGTSSQVNTQIIEQEQKERAGRMKLIRAVDLIYEPDEWLLKGWLKKGDTTIIAASGGAGKTTLALKIAAIASRGYGTLGNLHWQHKEPMGVAYYTSETEPHKLLPRFYNEGGVGGNFLVPQIVNEDGTFEDIEPNIEAQLRELFRIVKDSKGDGIGLLEFDPMLDIVNSLKNENSPVDVRELLRDFRNEVQKASVSVIGLMHFKKSLDNKPVDPSSKVSGSQAWVQFHRNVWAMETTFDLDHNKLEDMTTEEITRAKPKDYNIESKWLYRMKTNEDKNKGVFVYDIQGVKEFTFEAKNKDGNYRTIEVDTSEIIIGAADEHYSHEELKEMDLYDIDSLSSVPVKYNYKKPNEKEDPEKVIIPYLILAKLSTTTSMKWDEVLNYLRDKGIKSGDQYIERIRSHMRAEGMIERTSPSAGVFLWWLRPAGLFMDKDKGWEPIEQDLPF